MRIEMTGAAPDAHCMQPQCSQPWLANMRVCWDCLTPGDAAHHDSAAVPERHHIPGHVQQQFLQWDASAPFVVLHTTAAAVSTVDFDDVDEMMMPGAQCAQQRFKASSKLLEAAGLTADATAPEVQLDSMGVYPPPQQHLKLRCLRPTANTAWH